MISPAPLFFCMFIFNELVDVIDVLNPMADMTLNELWIMNGFGPTTK